MPKRGHEATGDKKEKTRKVKIKKEKQETSGATEPSSPIQDQDVPDDAVEETEEEIFVQEIETSIPDTVSEHMPQPELIPMIVSAVEVLSNNLLPKPLRLQLLETICRETGSDMLTSSLGSSWDENDKSVDREADINTIIEALETLKEKCQQNDKIADNQLILVKSFLDILNLELPVNMKTKMIGQIIPEVTDKKLKMTIDEHLPDSWAGKEILTDIDGLTAKLESLLSANVANPTPDEHTGTLSLRSSTSLREQLLPHFRGQNQRRHLIPSFQDPDPIPKPVPQKNVTLKPKKSDEVLGGFAFVCKIYALSHCMWAIKFVERINGQDKTVYTGAKTQPETIASALSSMTPPWYKTQSRLDLRTDETSKDEWFYYRSWYELDNENMDKMVDLLKKNMSAGAAKIRLKTSPTKDWTDKKNREAWTKNWVYEIVNVHDPETGTYKPLPWDVVFTNNDIHNLTLGRLSLFPELLPEDLEAAGGFFSPSSPFNFRMIINRSWAGNGEDTTIAFSDNI